MVILLALALMVGLMSTLSSNGNFMGSKPVTLRNSELMDAIRSKVIAEANWQGTTLTGKFISTHEKGADFIATVPSQESAAAISLVNALDDNKVSWQIDHPSVMTTLLSLLGVAIVPITFLVILWFLVIRPAQMGGNQALSFGRSKAKRVGESGSKVTFDDVAGIDEAKQELFEIVDFLKNTKKYTNLGAKIPKGILLTGPPGVGKTYLARAIAGEAGVPFFHISGSDFVEMFVGVGAARVRDLFETAKAHRPSLIFVDEIDAVGRQRGAGLGGGHDEREQTLNQLLVEMDGFDPNSGVILIAATNRPDVLDPALLRPGRFDRQIVVDAPDATGRLAILKIHSKNKPFDSDIDLDIIAKSTPGFTGADLANMLNESALLTARRGFNKIQQIDLEEALDRTIAGPQRRSRVIDPKERETIAFHEAGHAVVGELLEHADPVHKVTILPRGMSLGSTWQLPITDKYLVSNDELNDDITALLGGRVAEELVYNQTTTGASNDLERVTRIARAMVCEYGMSERLGTLALGRRSHNPFLGRDYNDERNYSEEVAKMIDEEVRAIVDRCHSRAIEILSTHREKLDAVVQGLLERETLSREEFLAVMAGEELPPRVIQQDQPSESAKDARESEKQAKTQIPPPRLEPGPA
ncbi:MAG: ATP-dependent zinc metalloprotease FtsH [Fimbriimonas sp.]|nr:ATP-dependent zinc metalloprotease FtsH [Fimbriimonas sp.]